jgi:hypothetical protein
VLGILYESFIHPLTILSGLPSAGLGALITLLVFKEELNIFSFVGIIMLIGIVKKNAIMMIDFAVDAQRTRGIPPDEVYSLVAYLFYQNGIIEESDVLDAKSLPKIQMPNRNGFVPATPVWPPTPKKPSWY